MQSKPIRNNSHFSVIIPSYNAEKTLGDCLEGLEHQSVARDEYEVIVVDDGSIDGTSRTAKGFDVKYIFQANQGPASARNTGAHAARGDIILYTDADCIPDYRWVEEMVRPFNDPGVIAVKGAYRTSQSQLVARFAQAEFEDRYDFLQSKTSIDMVDTYSAGFRKKIFQAMGGFDEGFPVANNEDTELSYRLASQGHKLVFNPRAIVYHFHPDTLMRYLRIKFKRGYWRMVVYRRFPEKAVKDSYTPGVIKIQAILMALSLPLFLFSWISPWPFYLALLCWSVVVVSSLPFSFKVFGKDKPVGLISPLFVFFRALVFCVGSLLGVARCLFRP